MFSTWWYVIENYSQEFHRTMRTMYNCIDIIKSQTYFFFQRCTILYTWLSNCKKLPLYSKIERSNSTIKTHMFFKFIFNIVWSQTKINSINLLRVYQFYHFSTIIIFNVFLNLIHKILLFLETFDNVRTCINWHKQRYFEFI